jgi:hypothetical protein
MLFLQIPAVDLEIIFVQLAGAVADYDSGTLK